MGAIDHTLALPRFAVPVPGHLLEQVTAWFERNDHVGGMSLVQGEARFTDPSVADAFAEEIGALWVERT